MASASTTIQSTTPTNIHVSSFQNRSIRLRAYVKKRRWIICIVIVILIIGMLLGLIFAARHYYLRTSSQGILGVRGEQAHLPSVVLPFDEFKPAVRANVPYYTCGDQLHNCGAFDQPNICCPVKTYCHPTSHSLSGIFCCNSTSSAECHVSDARKPQCPYKMIQCSKLSYGGCCPEDTICTPNGCIKVISASVVSIKNTAYSSAFMVLDGTVVTRTGQVSVTVTERPAATMTDVKYGEVAPAGISTGNSIFFGLCVPYTLAALLVIMALIMGFM